MFAGNTVVNLIVSLCTKKFFYQFSDFHEQYSPFYLSFTLSPFICVCMRRVVYILFLFFLFPIIVKVFFTY